jgi:thymidylate kinase
MIARAIIDNVALWAHLENMDRLDSRRGEKAMRKPPIAEAALAAGTLAPLIAIVGCDGSGKSTLTADMFERMRDRQPMALCYLGLGSGDIGERIKRWPLIGRRVEAHLARKASQTRTRDAKIPGLGTALVVFGFSLLRRRRFARMLALRRAGVAVIADRYPQMEVPGFYDGPGLSAARAGSSVVAWLARRERRMYEYMASYRPDVVIRLNVDLETAAQRKPDHPRASLAAKVAVTPKLRFNGARIVDLDSRRPYAEMRDAALQIAWAATGVRMNAGG